MAFDAFWLTTLVPGFALLRRYFPQDVRRGLLPTITWSYLLSVAIMAPFVGLAFAVHFSVQTVAAIYLCILLLSVFSLARTGWVKPVGQLLRSTPWFEVGIVLLAIAVTVPFGSSATDDSFPHAAKIRYMRDVGFYLQDPYSPLTVIETKWHVSVHHAFYAIESWLGDIEPLELWFRTGWFFRVTGVGAIGFLAATVFRSRWIGGVSMLGVLVYLATKKAVAYPFSMTAFTVFPVLFALTIDALEKPSRGRYVRIAFCSVALAALHVGTWFVDCLALGPTVAVWTIWRVGFRVAWPRILTIAGALAVGIPFLLVSALQPNYVDAQQGDQHLWMIRTVNLGSLWSFTIIDPIQYSWMLPVLAAVLLLLIVGRALVPRVAILAGTLATAMIFMFTPGLVDALSKVIPYWLAWRFRFIGEVIGFVTVSGGLAWAMRPVLATRLARMGLALAVLCGALAIFRQDILDYAVDRKRHWQALEDSRDLQDTVRHVIPAHSLVAADPQWSLVLPAVHLARVMGQDLHHANPADGGLLERYAAAGELLAEGTPLSRRREIIGKYGIDFILVREDTAPKVLDDAAAIGGIVAAVHGFRLYQVVR
jgi:hypothetical protein